MLRLLVRSSLLGLACLLLVVFVTPAFAANTGFLPASVSVPNDGSGFTTPNNAFVSDNAYATVTANNRQQRYTTFNLPAIPAGSVINGIEVLVEARHSNGTDANRRFGVELSWNNGGNWTNSNFTTGNLTTVDQTLTLGGTANNWGRTWAVGDFTNGNFQIRLQTNLSVGGTLSLDQVQVRVTYSPPLTITATAGTGGTITPSGAVSVTSGANQTFVIAPTTGYIVAGVSVDGGASVGRVNSYTFNNVVADHTIAATFESGWYAPAGNVNNNFANAGNAYSSNNAYATANNGGEGADYTTFNIPALPANATITGIEVALEGNRNGGRVFAVSLSWNNGANVTTAINSPNFAATDTTVIVGGSTNTWGRTWAPGDFTNANFRVRVAASGGGNDINLDQLQVRVTYTVPAATVLTVTPATGNYGGTVNLVATLTAGGVGVVGRTVTFTLNGVAVPGSATTGAGGVATLNNASLAGINIGTYTAPAQGVAANFAGDAAYAASSGTANLTVNPATTTTTLTGHTPSPSVVGQTVAMNVSVTSAAGTPAGTVTVSDGTSSCNATLAGGIGSCNITFTTAGARTVTASYAANGNFAASVSAGVAHTVNAASTTTTITSDTPDPTVIGQSFTVNYTVVVNAPGAGTPTGTVTVGDGVNSCVGTLPATSCVIALTTLGARNLTAVYAGDANFSTSTSAVASHTINKADTTTAITADNPDPSVVGQAVTVNYTVAVVAPGTGTPTGNVTVSDGVNSCTGTVAAGSCAVALSTLGNRTLTATYAGDAAFNGSTSAGVPHTVNKADTTTTITADTPDPSNIDQTVTINVTVAVSAPGAGTPTGTVTISDGAVSCNATLAAGAGSCTIAFATAGNRTLTATYGGDTNFNGSVSATAAHVVSQMNTTTTITARAPNPSVVGQSVAVTFTVTAASPVGVTPTGNVTVSDGAGTTCTASVAAGTCNLTFASAGNKTLTATYAGDSNFSSSASGGIAHTVNKADTTTTITSDAPDPSVVGQAVTVNFAVAVTAPGAGTPTGNVTVSDGTNSCIGTVAAGSCSITYTAPASVNLTATYAGDANFNGSVSANAPHTVNKADTTTAITSDLPDPSVVGQAVTVNFAVAVTAPGAGSPTGNVTVSDGTNSCIGTVAAGSCSITYTAPASVNLTATYAGDANFNGSVSANAPHTVNKANTTTTITSDAPDPSVVGQAVTVNFTVAVTAPGAGTATGNVTVSDGTDSCTGTVAAGTCSITFSASGNKTLTATYAGDANFAGSVSAGEPHVVDRAPTITAILSDVPDPSVVGQPVPITFSVIADPARILRPASRAPVPAPSGNVTVSDGTDSCTGTVAAGTCSIAFSSPGAKTLTATYAGDTNYAGSTSASEAHTVNKADTTTAITVDAPDASAIDQSVTFNFTVTPVAPGAGTPTGEVKITDGSDSCTATVAVGTCSIIFSTAGVRTLSATYAGDTNFNGSVSSPELHTVDKTATTTVIVADDPDPSVVGQSVIVTYTVTAGAASPATLNRARARAAVPSVTGNVTVSDGTDSCTGTVAEGSCTLVFTSAGAKTLTAKYFGDSNYAGSTSPEEQHVVNKANTTTTITADTPDPSTAKQTVNVKFAVAAAAPGAGTPTGSVTVSDGTISCVGALVAGAGSCNLTFMTSGARTLVAQYAGDNDFNASTSPGEPHGVDVIVTQVNLVSTPNPSTVGQLVTFTATLNQGAGATATAQRAPAYTGTVTFYVGSTVLCSKVPLNAANEAVCTTSQLTVGSHIVSAVYSGDDVYGGSRSLAVVQRVNSAIGASTVDIVASPAPAEVPEADTLLLMGGGLSGLMTWLGWQRRKLKARKK